MGKAGAFAAALLAALPALCEAQMYKCVDERGVTSYSDSPRAGCKGKEVDIRPQPPISGAVHERRSDFAREEAEFRRRQIDRGQSEAKEQAAVAERKRDCSRLKAEYARLDSGRRVVVSVNANGERSFLDDDVRQRRLDELRGKLAACP